MNEQQTWKSTLRCFLIVANVILGSFYFGYATAYMNVSQDTTNALLSISDSNKSVIDGLIQALLPVGAAFGALGSGALLGVLSRTQSLITTDIIGIIGLLISEIPNLYALFIARFIIGLAVGLNSSLVPLYIQEYTPLQLSGTMGSLNQFTINFGQLIAFIMGLGYNIENPANYNDVYWRIVYGLPIATNLIRIIVFLTVLRQDPPGYYAAKGDSNKALDVLQQIYKKAYINEVLNEIERDQRQKKQQASKYKDLISLLYKRRLQVGCFLSFLQQFCGINAIIFYSTEIFKEITDDKKEISILNIFVTLNNLIFSGVAVLLMKKYGRKTLLVSGDIVCMLCLFGLALFSFISDKNSDQIYKIITIIFLFGFLIAFQFSLGPITWLYIPEVLPEKGVSIAVLCNWVGTSIIAQVFPLMLKPLKIYGCFAIFGLFCFFGQIYSLSIFCRLFIIIFFVKETKGKTAQEIDCMYSLLKANNVYEGQVEKSGLSLEDQ